MTQTDVVTLITVEKVQGENGYPILNEVRKTVPVEVRSVARAEFYEAMKAGVSLASAFRMWACDYDGQTLLEYNRKRYAVVRTYTGIGRTSGGAVKDGEIELNCAEVV